MTFIENYVDIAAAVKIILFVVSGLFGMLFAYCRKWAHADMNAGLFMYMFGDERATMRAITTFVAMCVGAGGLSYLDTLTMNQIIIAGAGIGLLVPQTVEQKISAVFDAKNEEKKEFTLKAPPRKTEHSDLQKDKPQPPRAG